MCLPEQLPHRQTEIEVAPLDDGKSYIVEDGLNEGDIIIAEGAGLMKDGLEVEIQNSGLSNYYVN